ncbi:uncharacterized protein LOC126793029 [Argentina anserina]|uniref:uncharacterized protein LOC126793029 n=1 Tax=Argentina anserina TaxID=57926 RepID=UPI0021767C85|nr:uncharacterized protein LOC126793029 [Potentilla anserina]
MAATAPAPPWIPEDDLLLKNAIEAGASLEALARGAVRFSRKFTVRDLRERWHSLLYDADVAAEASARMLEFEACSSNVVPSKSNRFSQSRGSKRKGESMRKQYHALKKRLCADSNFGVNDFDINFLGGQAIGNHGSLDANCMVGGGVEPVFDGGSVFHGGECVTIGNRGVDGVGREGCGNEFSDQVLLVAANGLAENAYCRDNSAHEDLSNRGVNTMDFGNSLDAEDIGAHLWDVAAPEMPAEETLVIVNDADVDGDNMDSSHYEVGHNEAMLVDGEGCDELNRPAAISGGDYGDLASFLINDEVNSILLSSPKDVHDDDVPEFCEPQQLVLGSCEAVSMDSHTGEMAVSVEQTGHDDQQDILCPDASMPSSSTSIPLHPSEVAVAPVVPDAPEMTVAPEAQQEEMTCSLNTEVLDIPCNDDIFFLTAVVQTSPQPSSNEAITDQRKCDQQIETLETNADLAQPFSKESPNPTHDKIDLAAGHCGLADATLNCITKGLLNEEEIKVPGIVADLASLTAELGSTSIPFPEPQTRPSALECEESDEESDDDIDDGWDTDIPCFSDIETMILEMDLCPADEEADISKRVSKYQHEDAKRKIIRLEQCAQSSMQRALASKGTLAVLYDHHVKHYIKKTKVIIGRTTEDYQVDIDLGDNKVSRRQAIIQMDADGSFSLKNLGRNSIFLNGREIANGELLSFASTNLIEIREMAFVFEINHKSVRQYLAKIATKIEGHANVELAPEGFS